MAISRSCLSLLLSVLILFNIYEFTQRYDLPSPYIVYNYVAINLPLLMPQTRRRRHNDDVFINRKTLSPPPKEIFNEEDMVTLTEKNFTNFISKNRHVMVIFHSPRIGVSSDCAALAMKLMGAEVAAKVDISQERALEERYKIVRYPSLYLFPGGDKYYSEWDLGVSTQTPVEGMFRGNLFRRSGGEDLVESSSDGPVLMESIN